MYNSLQLCSTYEWDIDGLRTEEFLNVPLERAHEDFVAWAFEKSGLYLVRSAYHLLTGRGRDTLLDAENPSTSFDPAPLWKAVWNLRVPPRLGFSVGGGFMVSFRRGN